MTLGKTLGCLLVKNPDIQRKSCRWRVNESKRTPLLINQVPAKSRRTHLSPRFKYTYSPYKACRNSHLPLGRTKSVQTEELDSIRRELSKIKARVDSLLESLESMEQQREQHTGQVKNQASDQDSQEVGTLPGSAVTSWVACFPLPCFWKAPGDTHAT
ncbi:heterogeneous nuclear ribonucleoprotein C-like 1 isoform X3 [Peromyscus californicus insignis]|uniref:heterogeneous nuclear ribonucleoprotein C-like 1 isoform X3 n=1 Tax=Peromyscus californicus insignis TaxID=564181 RepID=UPI0022A6AE5E|nr:heterogeneous nuclear ribonucleoprotein C-like 1 isoform X3 [Peromyscus californicus insignis]